VEAELGRWADTRRTTLGELEAFDPTGWKQLGEFGLLHGTAEGMRHVDVAAGLLSAARGGLPGPVLEALLAVSSGSVAACTALDDQKVVTSLCPGPVGAAIVGWGAVADLVIDQTDGHVVATGPLPSAQTALPMAHGVCDRTEVTSDRDPTLRWLYGSAILTGLGLGAVMMARDYVRERHQFGRPLGSFQAVQFRLAESIMKLDAARLMVLDAARHLDEGDSVADVTSAMAWTYASDLAGTVEKHTHQVFGAMGFTEEMGLVRLSYQSVWVRTSNGGDTAVDLLLSRRKIAEGIPPSVLLDGFGAA